MYQFGPLHSRFNVTPMIGPLTRPRASEDWEASTGEVDA
jgi:hypothetical protein